MTDARPTVSDLNARLNTLSLKVEASDKSFDPQEHKDKTRSKMAFTFTVGYFALLAITLIGVPAYNMVVLQITGASDLALQLQDILLAISGIASGPIGFVVGYYFKGSEQNGNSF